VRLLKVYCI